MNPDPESVPGGALLEQEELHRLLFEQAADAMYLVDGETGRLLDANDVAARVTGYSKEELRGMTTRDLHPPEEHSFVAEIRARLRSEGSLRVAALNHRRKDGQVFPVELSLSAVDVG